MLASMTVEKYIKAVLGIRGTRLSGHLDNYTVFDEALRQSDTRLPEIPKSFLATLGKAYALRYYNQLKSRTTTATSCGFFHWQVLAELDHVVYHFEKLIDYKKPGHEAFPTPYQHALNQLDEAVTEQNWLVTDIKRSDVSQRPGFLAKYVEDTIVILEFYNDAFASPYEQFVGATVELSSDRRQVALHFTELMNAPSHVLSEMQMVAHES